MNKKWIDEVLLLRGGKKNLAVPREEHVFLEEAVIVGGNPKCPDCGHITIRNGACYKCLNCGASVGCG